MARCGAADVPFAFKASRFITHPLRLRDSGAPLAELQARAVLLGPKLGPVLFQLPPTFPLDLSRLGEFVAQLDSHWRWVMEFRHPSWHQPDVYDALGRHAVALCIPIGGPVFPDLVVTAPFVYLRFHAGRAPGGGFEAEVLREWAGRLRGVLHSGLDAYVYFNNDRDGHAVRDAQSLTALLQRDRSP